METLKAVLNSRYERYQKEIDIYRKNNDHIKCAELCFKQAEISCTILDIMKIEQCNEAK